MSALDKATPAKKAPEKKAPGIRQTMSDLHIWAGLLVGWILYAMFLTGTVSYFKEEISQWMRPELAHQAVVPDAAEVAPRVAQVLEQEQAFYADLMLFHPETPTEVKERVKADFANSDPVIGYGTILTQMQYASADAERLEQLNYKLYLINSDGFPTNYTGLKNHCKKSFQVETIYAAGHYPMIEKPTEFTRALEKVLAAMKLADAK